jgi:hypothetical protein
VHIAPNVVTAESAAVRGILAAGPCRPVWPALSRLRVPEVPVLKRFHRNFERCFASTAAAMCLLSYKSLRNGAGDTGLAKLVQPRWSSGHGSSDSGRVCKLMSKPNW